MILNGILEEVSNSILNFVSMIAWLVLTGILATVMITTSWLTIPWAIVVFIVYTLGIGFFWKRYHVSEE